MTQDKSNQFIVGVFGSRFDFCTLPVMNKTTIKHDVAPLTSHAYRITYGDTAVALQLV